MTRFFLATYDFFVRHRLVAMLMMCAVITLMGVAAMRLKYNEDIIDFLPLTAQQRECMDIYQDISGAERVVIIVEGGTTDDKLDALDAFAAQLGHDSPELAERLTTRIDIDAYLDIMDFVRANIALFLTDEDYQRMDSVLAKSDAARQGIDNCRRMLQMPLSAFAQRSMAQDPLSLFGPVVAELMDFMPTSDNFTALDGYMLTGDERLAFAFLDSPYGANETGHNALLTKQLQGLCHAISHDDVQLRLLGAPVISVANAERIKKDTALAVCLALVLIIGVLLYCFRHDKRSILLIMLTIGFGWLAGMAAMSLMRTQVSMIVLGMGSIIIGIAVNYPLHVLFHRRYTTSVRQTLEEVLKPLIIGNITTVGAFLALLPLDAVALADLGLFAAAMLVGTIVFSVIFLPLLMPSQSTWTDVADLSEQPAGTGLRRTWRYGILAALVVLTAALWLAGRDISFDADIANINYMTEQQRHDVQHFAALNGTEGKTDIYLVENQPSTQKPGALTVDSGIRRIASPYRWLPGKQEQERRIGLWNDFWALRREALLHDIRLQATEQGFAPHAFDQFAGILTHEFTAQEFDFFAPLAHNILRGYWAYDSQQTGEILTITRLTTGNDRVPQAEQALRQQADEQALVFDIKGLNSTLAAELSANFDYIGIVCSLLVFVFLLITMQSWRAAAVAFLPMAISWVWILGIMNLLGLQFNIVNVILATFIFGQGDDYTIFVVEGLQHEQQTGKRMLPQYRSSIILSAVIMFVGIGVLVIAQHPAMRSLGAVTLIGMAVVVLLANVIPPLLREVICPRQSGRFRSSKRPCCS